MLYNDNPFKVLGVSPIAGRRTIVGQAEEQALLQNADLIADARAILTNPQKRIAAEASWFLDCSDEEIDDIKSYIADELARNSNDGYAWGNRSPLTQLNIQLACIDAQDFSNVNSAKYYILGISRLFEAVDSEDILSLINQARQTAGFPEVTKLQDVDAALAEIRVEIRQAISQKLQNLAIDQYVQTVTALSESYSGNERYKGHAVLEDVIADYQVFINDTLQKNGRDIIAASDRIAHSAEQINIEQDVDALIEQLYEWDKYAQPLQLGALTKGSAHELSREILQKLRGLALKLNNQYSLSAESLKITKAIQEVFKELPEFSELLTKDSETLTRIVAEQEVNDIVDPVMPEIEDAFDNLLRSSGELSDHCLDLLVEAVENASQELEESTSDSEFSDLLRSELFMRVRSLTIKLHNENERTEDAYHIMYAMLTVFSDIPKIRDVIESDVEKLSDLLEAAERSDEILKGIEEIEQLSGSIKTALISERKNKIASLISKMGVLNGQIKNSIEDSDTQTKVRERLAYMVRSVGIMLHNEKHDSESALRIMTAVKKEFPDIESLQATLDKEILTLYRMTGGFGESSDKSIERQKQKAEGPKTRNVVILAIALLAIVAVAIELLYPKSDTPNSTSNTTSYSVSTPRPTSTPAPTPTPTPQEMPVSGNVFYCSDSYTPSTFTVRNSGSSNYYMKFVTAGTDTTVITFFVRANSTVTINMPAGNLELRYAYGSTWYGESLLFGDETRYAKDEEPYDFSNYTWEISLYTTLNYGEDMDVEDIGADEF